MLLQAAASWRRAAAFAKRTANSRRPVRSSGRIRRPALSNAAVLTIGAGAMNTGKLRTDAVGTSAVLNGAVQTAKHAIDSVVVAGLFLVRQHRLVSPGDLSRVDAAFFTANGWLSVAVFVLGAADVLLR